MTSAILSLHAVHTIFENAAQIAIGGRLSFSWKMFLSLVSIPCFQAQGLDLLIQGKNCFLL